MPFDISNGTFHIFPFGRSIQTESFYLEDDSSAERVLRFTIPLNIDKDINCVRELHSLFSGVYGCVVSKCFRSVYIKHYIVTHICNNLTIMCMFALPFCENIHANYIYCTHCVSFGVANKLTVRVVHFISKSEKTIPERINE